MGSFVYPSARFSSETFGRISVKFGTVKHNFCPYRFYIMKLKANRIYLYGVFAVGLGSRNALNIIREKTFLRLGYYALYYKHICAFIGR